MPSSQTHRPAVSIKRSPDVRLKKLLASATDLEQQLASLPKPKNEGKASRLKHKLCETLSDIMLSDPVFALENDCSGRLWRTCFYAQIGTFRSRISREKRKRGPNVATFEKDFQNFLKEAITLYDYLVNGYLSMLMPPSSQDFSQESTQDSLGDDSPTSSDGVVKGLYKLYIHLGDLHRYEESYAKAEGNYSKASRIAPGMGNPYNQLAVVAQMRDANMSCVALYWYARSLLATHEPFETSGSNLERLFDTNREYLQVHARDKKPPILPATNKKTSNEMAKAQRQAVSKACLAHFIDFQVDLLKNEKTDSATEGILKEKLESLFVSLQSLLNASAFGDALLCKMVVISAFSLATTTNRANSLNRQLSEDLVFKLGTALGERLLAGLTKIAEKAELPQSIRLLLPVILICDYVGELNYDCDRREVVLFWKQYASVGNVVVQMSERFDLQVGNDRESARSWTSIKDYKSFRGFKPFRWLNMDYPKQDPFVSPSEAVEILELTQSQSQRPIVGGSDETISKVLHFLDTLEACAKDMSVPICRKGYVFEYNEIKKPLTDKEDTSTDMEGIQGGSIDNQVASVESIAETSELYGGKTHLVGDPLGTDSAQDAAGDVIIYDAPQNGDGPDLLIPGKVLADSYVAAATAKSPTAEPKSVVPSSIRLSKEFASPLAPENPGLAQRSQPQSLQPPPGLTPPPGFGAPITQAINNVPPLQNNHFGQIGSGAGLGSTGHENQPFPSPQSTPIGVPMTVVGSQEQQSSMPFANNQHLRTVGNSLDWFGGNQALETNNPFANIPTGLMAPPAQNAAYEADATVMDGAALLGSGFLESLFTNDAPGNQTTRNPFATK